MRKTFLVVLFALFGIQSFAQTASNSPYSRFGLGEQNGKDHYVFSGIGNTEITMIDSTVLNFYNPASYNSLGKGQPIFSLGISSRLSQFELGTVKEFNPRTTIQHFAFGFSFSKFFGMGVGIRPYSERVYSISTGEMVGSDSIAYNYSGNGGINEAYLSFSSDLFHFDSTRLSVGFTAGWLFGYVSDNRSSWIVSGGNQTGGVGVKTLDVRSFHYDFGAYFQHTFSANHKMGLYATIDPSQKLNASYEEGVFYASNVENPNTYDTTFHYSLDGNRLTTALGMKFGLSYEFTFADTKEMQRDRHPSIALHASYGITDWSLYNNPYDANTNYLNTTKFTTGIQFIPEVDLENNATNLNVFEKMRYRAGFYSYTLPYTLNGTQVSDFGTTFGIGLPVSFGNSVSSVNLGLTYGNRGTSDANQLKERYYGINFGISIAPEVSDRWFRKRKIN